MAMMILVTRNACGRTRGFLASCLCEIAPGVYAGALTKRVREQVWHVVERWHPLGADRSAVMVWLDKSAAGGQAIRVLGESRHDFVEWQGAAFVRRDLTAKEKTCIEKLKTTTCLSRH